MPTTGSGTGNRNDSEIAVRESYRKLGRVFSTARHDINNQLTIINGYLSILEVSDPAMKTPDIVRILLGAATRIEQILKFTREYQNIGEKPPEWKVLGETICLGKEMTENGPVRFVPDPSCNEVEVYADPLLPRVFYNLIDNSLRYGGENLNEIQIHCATGGTGLTITFQDNGVGITDKIRPLLFEQGRGKNTGNGLFLVKEILAATGITIAEKGVSERGACFEIIVPAGTFRCIGRQ